MYGTVCGLCVQAIRQTVLRLGCTDYGEEFSGSLPDIEIEQQEKQTPAWISPHFQVPEGGKSCKGRMRNIRHMFKF
ncbi:MAG: hypothetical protein HFG88_09025 [Dorea sp.]|nr:hypothetical protein [Dorea sp.]